MDDEDDEDRGRNVGLPKTVEKEIERRKELKNTKPDKMPAPNQRAVVALREHFASGLAKPRMDGSYISLMWKLGAKPRSDDPLVRDIDKNRGYFGYAEQDTQEYWRKEGIEHKSEVRLLRYGEFIDTQKKKDMGFPDSFYFELKEGTDVGDVDQDQQDEEDADEWDITREQLVALGTNFSARFYTYVNRDRMNLGLADGVTTRPVPDGVRPPSDDLQFFNIELSKNDLLHQCQELYVRYREQMRPLGKANRTGNNDEKAIDQKHHATLIREHVSTLMTTLEEKVMAPTAATATTVCAIFEMLNAASAADPDITLTLTDMGGKPNNIAAALFRLRSKSLEYAIAADADKSRSKKSADAWWDVCRVLTELTGVLVVNLCIEDQQLRESIYHANKEIDADRSKAGTQHGVKFFKELMAPALLKSLNSNFSAEKQPALYAMDKAVCALPREVSISLVKDKGTWRLLELACTAHLDVDDNTAPPVVTRVDVREKRMATSAAIQASTLIGSLSARGMEVDHAPSAITAVAPGAIARKMSERGIVPLLMKMARSPLEEVSSGAMRGLGQMSRLKDCRTLLLQLPDSVELIHDMLASSNGNTVSETMLLVVHLLWDEEWRDPLMRITPPIEVTAMKWALYSTTIIRDRAYDLRSSMSKKKRDFTSTLWKTKLVLEDQHELEKLKLQISEENIKVNNELQWLELETENWVDPAIPTLSRSMLMMSTMCHDYEAPKRLLEVNAPSLAAACLDVPLEDTTNAAIALLSNFVASCGKSILPGVFPDPLHVVDCLIHKAEGFEESGETSTNRVFMTENLIRSLSRCSDWEFYFREVARNSPSEYNWIELMFPRVGPALPSNASPRSIRANSNVSTDLTPGVHSTCAELTGKLLRCQGCGKIEGKKGEFKNCGACKVTQYCGRECQCSDWKKHKKQCASIAAAAAAYAAN